MRPKYWKGVFANSVESELIEGDLAGQFDGEIPKGAVVPRAYVRIQRSGLRGVAERTRLTILQLLAEVPASYWPDELWNQPEAGYIVFAWETPDTSQLPVGFAAFTVHIMDDAEGVVSTNRPFENVLFSYDLVFVRPAKRGVGFGKYLSGAIREWIGRCRVIPPRCSNAGVHVLYFADFDSRGGEVCSLAVSEYFQYLLDSGREPPIPSLPPIPWHISSFRIGSDC